MSSGKKSGTARALRFAIPLVIVAAAAIAIGRGLDEEQLIALVDHLREYGRHWWAPAALIGAMVVINLVGLPGTPLTLASGAVWGWMAGSAWMMVATIIGTALPYLIARRGLGGIRERLSGRYASALGWIEESGFTAVTVLRLVHLFPFAVVSYGAGIAGVRAAQYVAGTFVGTLPGVLVWCYLADSILAGMLSPAEAKQRIILAALMVAALVVGSALLGRRLRRA